MTDKQFETKSKIEMFAGIFGIDPAWASAVAMVESSLGENQVSPTGCVGVFQMSTIAMKDILDAMMKEDDDLIDIACGIGFLRLLLRRWGTEELATIHYCDPKDRSFYWDRVKRYMDEFKAEPIATVPQEPEKASVGFWDGFIGLFKGKQS